jgi:hypothetical protein
MRATRIGIASVALALCAAVGVTGPAMAATLAFDGSEPGKVLQQTADYVTGAELGAVSLRFTPRYPSAPGQAAAQPGAMLLGLYGPSGFLGIGLGSQPNQVRVINGSSGQIDLDLRPGAGGTLDLVLRGDPGGGWAVADATGPVGSLPKGFFDPKPDDVHVLQVGSRAFVGSIDKLDITPRGGEAIVTIGEGGELLKRLIPRLGIYRQVDSELSAPRRDRRPATTSGLYEKEPFFALVQRDGRLGMVFDWGPVLDLVADKASPRRFVPAEPDFTWAGAIEFAAGSNEVFTVRGISGYRPMRAFLRDGATYIHVDHLGDLTNQHPSGQMLDEVWVADAKPSGFNQSIKACFDVERSDLVDFQNTGCPSTVFQLPPLESANYRASDDNTIIPYGWRYDRRHRQQGDYFSSMATTTSEVEKSFNGSTGFTLGGGSGGEGDGSGGSINLSDNFSYAEQRADMLKDERMVSVHQNIATSHAIVLDPIYARLNDCFIRRVLRMDPQAQAPAYFNAEADPERRASGADDSDECSEDYRGPRAVPLTPATFLDLYGSHYAYAITYGAWGRQTVSYSGEAVQQLIGQETKVDDGIGGEIKAQGVKLGLGETSSSERQTLDKLASEGEVETGGYVCIGGSSCSDGRIDAGANLIPVYLDLRTLDGLLAPPYFLDPRVTVDLRAKVRAEIKRRMTVPALAGTPPFQVVRFLVTEVRCEGNRDFANTLCHPNRNLSPLKTVDLVAYGRLADGRRLQLAPPQSYRVTDLMAGLPAKLISVPIRTPGGVLQSVELSIAPQGSRPAGGATWPGDCCDQDWALTGVPTISAETAPFNWLDDAKLAISSAPAMGKGRARAIVMPLNTQPQRQNFDQPALELTGPAQGRLMLKGSIEIADIATELGFPPQPEWVTAAFESYDDSADVLLKPGLSAHAYMACPTGSWKTELGCQYSAPQQTCPPGLARYGNICAHTQAPRKIRFSNEAPIIASAEVVYVSGGRARRETSGTLAVGNSFDFALPADALGVVVQGIFHNITGMRPVFAMGVDLTKGPACFAMTGSAFRVGWRTVLECAPS